MISTIFIYCLECNILLAGFFFFFILILKKETHFQLNRIYLLSSVILSFVIPLINISLPDYKSNTTNTFQSFISYLQEYKNIFDTDNSKIQISETTNQISGKESSHVKQSLFSIKSAFYSAQLRVLLFYCGISIIILCKVLYRIYGILNLVVKNPRIKKKGITYVYLNTSISPFSFLRFIFLPQDIHSHKNYSMILTHEKIHIRQFHSIDILVMEGVSIFFWFNPVIWIYKRLFRDLHEYLADSSVIHLGYSKNEYQTQLLTQGLINNGLIGCNFVHNNLTKRVVMITKNKSSYYTKFKLLLVLPIIVIMICMFSISYSKENAHKNPKKLNKLELSLTVSDSVVELSAIGGRLPLITYTKLNNEYCLTDEHNNIKYGLFSNNDKVLLNKKSEIVTKVAVGDTVYEGYFYNRKTYKEPRGKNSFLDKNSIIISNDFLVIRKPFSLSKVIDNMLFSICQRFAKADDITSITLNIDDSVSYELIKNVRDIAVKNGFRNIIIDTIQI